MHSPLSWRFLSAGMLALTAASATGQAIPREPGEIVWAIRYDPRTFDPAKVDDQDSEIVRYLTSGVLLRINRETQQPEPQLAQSFHLSADGKLLSFKLRNNLHFSDGSSLTSADVAWSLRRVLAGETKAPVADEFLSPERSPSTLPMRSPFGFTCPSALLESPRYSMRSQSSRQIVPAKAGSPPAHSSSRNTSVDSTCACAGIRTTGNATLKEPRFHTPAAYGWTC